MSETVNEAPLAPAPEAAPAAAPSAGPPQFNSPGEAVDYYAAQGREIAAAEAAPASDVPAPVEAPAGDGGDQPADVALSEDFLAGYNDALAALGYDIPQPEPQPDDEGFHEWAVGEQQRLVDSMLELGVDPQALAQNLAQFRASRAAAQQLESQRAQHRNELALNHLAGLAEAAGAAYVDPAAALGLVQRMYVEVSREHGEEVARQRSPQFWQQAVNQLAAETESSAEYGVQLAREYTSHLPNVDPVQVLAAAEEMFPRRLRQAGGDEKLALEQSFTDAARQVGGEPTHPSQITKLYSQNGHRIRQGDTSEFRRPPGMGEIAAKYAALGQEIAAKGDRR